MVKKLDGKVAIITGAASGFGMAMVKEFSKEGARIFAIDINDKVEKLKEEIDGEIQTFKADVSDPEQVANAFKQCRQTYGRLDILCNNAGITGLVETPMHEYPLDEWNRVFSVNVQGALLVLQESIKMMLKSGGGSIVNTGSIGGFRATPGSSAYIVSKGAMVMLTKQAALEYIDKGIRVNSINPGTCKTPLLNGFTDEMLDFLGEQVPIGRLGEPEEVAKLALFLASDDSSYITGQNHIIDGGRAVV